MALDPAGNIYVTGTDGNGYITVKLSADGKLLWSTPAAGRSGWYRESADIALDDTGGIYVTGGLPGSRDHTFTYCDFFQGCQDYRLYAPDLVTLKYDNRGRRQWEAAYFEPGIGYFTGTDIAIDRSGAVYAVGNTVSPPPGPDIYVTGTIAVKYDAAGQQLWVKKFNPLSASPLEIHGHLASLDRQGRLCLTGASGTRMLDADGNELWSAAIKGLVLQLDDAGNTYVTGHDLGNSTTTKLDASGKVVWTAPFGGRVLTLDNDGNVFVAGFNPNSTPTQYIATKLDRQGQPLWRVINNATSAEIPSATTDTLGNFYITEFGGIVRYDANGIRVWQHPPNAAPYGKSLLALDSSGNVIVANGTASDGFVVTKYAQAIVPGAPIINGPPDHPLMRAGESVTLRIGASGNTPLAYQWRTMSGPIPDETNATLTLRNVQPDRAGLYGVEVSNNLGSTAALGVFVNLLAPLATQTVVQGATATFSVPLIGGGPAAYQWQFNGTNLPNETRATLTIPNAGLERVGDYTVIVSNYYGNALTSTVARLKLERRVMQSWAAVQPNGNVGDVGQALGVDAAGNTFVVGYSACGHKIVKYDSAGQKLWETCAGSQSSIAGLVVDATGQVFVAGGSSATKYSPAGSVLWTTHFDDGTGSSNDVANAVSLDAAGNLYLSGTSASGANGTDIITAKFSPSGQQVWAARFNGSASSDDVATAIKVDRSGNVLVSGASAGPNGYDFAILKYGPNGNLIWTRTYDGPVHGRDVAAHLAVDATGAVYVTGWSVGESYLTDFATLKYDGEGNRLWVARYNGVGNGEDNPHGLGVDAAGNVFVTGSSIGAGPYLHYDIALVKYAPDGSQLWVQRYNGPANLNDYSRALGLDDAGNVYVEGQSESDLDRTTEVVTLSYDRAGNPRWAARYQTGVESGSYYRNGSLQVDAGGTVYVTDTTFNGGVPSFLTLKYIQPFPLPRLTTPLVLPDGGFRCGVTGEAGVRYTIQVSGDLISWTSLTDVNTSGNGSTEFTDTTTPHQSHRFYRAVRP